MIINHERLIDYLANWLADYIKAAGKSIFVVGFRGTRADALLLHLCSKATETHGGLSTHSVEFPYRIGMDKFYNGKGTIIAASIGDEFSYLKCHEIAGDNGIVVGPIDRTFGLYYRGYGKLSEGSADIFPLFDLKYSDIVEITDKLWPGVNWEYELQFPTIQDLEFCDEAERLYGIITNDVMPNKHPRWPYFVHYQKQIIALVHQREKSTRHKKIDRPYPSIKEVQTQ